MKRGTEDLDFFIGDEALAAANGPGMHGNGCMAGWEKYIDSARIQHQLPHPPWSD